MEALELARGAALHFAREDEIASLELFSGGNINDSWLLTLDDGQQWLLQRLNPRVFARPDVIMRNMRVVLDRLAAAMIKNNIPPAEYHFFSIGVGRDGTDMYWDPTVAAWRLIRYIPRSRCLHTVDTTAQASDLGRKLGLFHRLVSDLDPETLTDPLPDLHNTPQYLADFDKIVGALRRDGRGRNTSKGTDHDRQFCYQFIKARRALVTVLEKERQQLTTQVIHGDPKVANFLFDRAGRQVISLVDLDTLKPGLLLHDIGDALRSCCASGGEEAANPQQGVFDAVLFEAWLQGYHEEFGFGLTEKEQKRIVAATMLITFELGLRFFTDHLNGDTYFKTTFPGQNLARALIQFQLVQCQEQQADRLRDIASRVFR